MDEKQFVLDMFEQNFKSFAGRKLVIYGVGKNTGHIVAHFSGHNILGLMDEAETGNTLYGKPVLSNEQALDLGVEVIVIVARASNVRIIYRRIAGFCTAHGIEVYDINGNLLGAQQHTEKDYERYQSISSDVLEEKIEAAEVVSFDVFDTLVMRRVLYPADVFHLVEAEAQDDRQGFARARAEAEQSLYREGTVANIHQIYERLQQMLQLPDEQREQWKASELAMEKKCLLPRQSVCDALRYAADKGKEIYLVSDMYLPGDIMHKLLREAGVPTEAVRELIVSCDHGMTKSGGLFGVLRKATGTKRILHIGDSPDWDGRCAAAGGVDDIFLIESAAVMLEDSYASELLLHDGKLANRVRIGEFIARQLNDPFLFARTQGRFEVNSGYEAAYSFFSSIICTFYAWVLEKAKELQMDHILFSSRDGYLLWTMAKCLMSKAADWPKMHYFYTSRAVASLAGLHSDEDILYLVSLPYEGTLAEMLQTRFRLEEGEILERDPGEDDDAWVLRHRDAIYRHSRQMRQNYLRYIDTLAISKGSRVGFMDFVSSATCQKFLSQFVDFDLHGLYFARIHDSYKKDMVVEAMMGAAYAYKDSYHVLENFFLMENIMCSYEPTLDSFDEAGRPVFAGEPRSAAQLDNLRVMHDAILNAAEETVLPPWQITEVDRALSDLIFHTLSPQYSVTADEYMITDVIEDLFCNRKFTILKVGEI